MNTVVILFVTVCLGAGDDVSCEEFGLESWQGAQAMQECTEYLQREVQYSEMQGTVQTWKCVDVTPVEENKLL
jgi:hypothetical protein